MHTGAKKLAASLTNVYGDLAHDQSNKGDQVYFYIISRKSLVQTCIDCGTNTAGLHSYLAQENRKSRRCARKRVGVIGVLSVLVDSVTALRSWQTLFIDALSPPNGVRMQRTLLRAVCVCRCSHLLSLHDMFSAVRWPGAVST